MVDSKRQRRPAVDPDEVYRRGLEAEREGLDPGVIGRAGRLAPCPFLVVVERILAQALREPRGSVKVSVERADREIEIRIRLRRTKRGEDGIAP